MSKQKQTTDATQTPARPAMFERLEDRRLMSAGSFTPAARPGTTITFAEAPAAVQTGLTTLAGTDSVTAPTADTTVYLGNADGVETYAIAGATAARPNRLTVDLAGDAVAAPTRATTTFGAVTDTAVTAEFTAIATALGLTAPTTDTSVATSTTSAGDVTYTVRLAGTSTGHGQVVSLNAAGDPVGNARLPLSVFSTAVRTTLTDNAPSGATALASTSLVNVKTANGVTTYSVTYKTTGIRTTVSVDTAGALADTPDQSQVEFSTLPTAAQTELQTLATADGVTDTIATTQYVTAYDEGNGTTVYSVRLSTSTTTTGGSTRTYGITLSVDQLGNPTVPPTGFGFAGPGGGGGGGFGRGGFPSGGFHFTGGVGAANDPGFALTDDSGFGEGGFGNGGLGFFGGRHRGNGGFGFVGGGHRGHGAASSSGDGSAGRSSPDPTAA